MEIAGIILAGGQATRLGRVQKSFVEIGGRRLIERVLDVYRPLFSEIVIAAREPGEFAQYDYPVAVDKFDARCSLTGIHAGLSALKASHAFVSSCDAPFLQPGLVQTLLDEVTEDIDIVVPRTDEDYLEPLCAVYSKRCLGYITPQIEQRNYMVNRFFKHMKVREVREDKLRLGDPDMLSIFNVNWPEDIETAERMAAEKGL